MSYVYYHNWTWLIRINMCCLCKCRKNLGYLKWRIFIQDLNVYTAKKTVNIVPLRYFYCYIMVYTLRWIFLENAVYQILFCSLQEADQMCWAAWEAPEIFPLARIAHHWSLLLSVERNVQISIRWILGPLILVVARGMSPAVMVLLACSDLQPSSPESKSLFWEYKLERWSPSWNVIKM